MTGSMYALVVHVHEYPYQEDASPATLCPLNIKDGVMKTSKVENGKLPDAPTALQNIFTGNGKKFKNTRLTAKTDPYIHTFELLEESRRAKLLIHLKRICDKDTKQSGIDNASLDWKTVEPGKPGKSGKFEELKLSEKHNGNFSVSFDNGKLMHLEYICQSILSQLGENETATKQNLWLDLRLVKYEENAKGIKNNRIIGRYKNVAIADPVIRYNNKQTQRTFNIFDGFREDMKGKTGLREEDKDWGRRLATIFMMVKRPENGGNLVFTNLRHPTTART